MAVNGTQPQHDADLLACGRDAAKVWDRAAAGHVDIHERDCRHCQAVAEDQRLLATAIAALAEANLRSPPLVVERVMDAVLAELRPADYLPLHTRHGHARIDRVTAAGVLRHAVDQMSVLRVRSCQIRIPETSDIDVRIRVSVSARFGTDLLSAIPRVRQMIIAAAEDLLGLHVAAVDVDVVDVFEDPARCAH